MRCETLARKPSRGTPNSASDTRCSLSIRARALASLADLTEHRVQRDSGGTKSPGARPRAAGPRREPSADDALLARLSRSNRFARELVGSFVELDARVAANVDEPRRRPFGEAIAH